MRTVKRDLRHLNIWPYLWIMALALVLLWTLLSKREFWTGYDTYFHMNGIYEDAMQIKTGRFSYFLSTFGFEKSGRIVNALYGPVFNYLCGALLLACHSWVRFEFWLFFITLVISGVGVYWCARALQIKSAVATGLAMFYLTSEPVVLVWLSDWEFIGLGATVLLPFVVLAGVKIFQQHWIRVVPLAILMAICLQIHLMTTVVATLVLSIFTLGGFLQSNRKIRMIKNGCLAALLAFCLSGNVFGAIYDVYSTNHVVPTFPNFNLQRAVNHSALKFSGFHVTELGRWYTFCLVLIIILLLVKIKSTRSLDWCLLIINALFIWLSSAYFPWNALTRPFPWLASVVQFPSRFMGVSFLVTLLLLGRVLTVVRLKPKVAVLGLAILFLVALHGAFTPLRNESRAWNSPQVVRYWVKAPKGRSLNGDQLRAAFRSHDLSRGINAAHKVTSDYLPTPRRIDLYRYYRYPIGKEYAQALQHRYGFHKCANDHRLMLTWRSNHREEMTVPLVKYDHTVVALNHKRVDPKQTLTGTMKVRARPGMNKLSVQYRPGIAFKVLSAVTMISWLLICLMAIKKKNIV